MNVKFFVNSALLGVGLAMDAFAVSMANGLNDAKMSRKREATIAATFAGFQFLMPMIGWLCVRTIAQYFEAFQRMIPWIALILLGFIGGKMLKEGIENLHVQEEVAATQVSVGALIVQGIATSIDALSVGFAIADYSPWMAFVAALIIAVLTFAICIAGVEIGKKFGVKLAGKASVLGGVILIGIGIEIFLSNML